MERVHSARVLATRVARSALLGHPLTPDGRIMTSREMDDVVRAVQTRALDLGMGDDPGPFWVPQGRLGLWLPQIKLAIAIGAGGEDEPQRQAVLARAHAEQERLSVVLRRLDTLD